MDTSPLLVRSGPSAHSGPASPRRRLARRVACLCLLPVCLFFSACVSEPSAVSGEKQAFGYSWEQELQLGAEADKEITSEMGLYPDPRIQDYVEQLGQRVLAASDFREASTPELYRDTKFTFRVMDSPVVNAFALPGGYIYVTRGLLSHVQNEAQLAVVLGHEIAHVAARHSSQQARRAQIGQIGLVAGAILGQQVFGEQLGDNFGTLLNLGSQALELFMMRYSREAEHESDQLGVRYAKGAGFAAAEGAEFFHSLQRLSADEGKAIPAWQSTHPDPGDRAQRVIQLAATGAPGTIVNEEEYLRRLEGIVVGENPREGFTQNGVFYHPDLQFQFNVLPGWKLQNQKAAVVLAEPNGQAMIGFRLAPGASARDAAAQFVQESKVQVTASGDTQINGLPATVIVGQGQSEQGTLGVWNAFIEKDGRVFSFMGLAPAQVFPQVQPAFESVAAGFSQLRDARIASVQPARLRIVAADRAGPLASFIPTSLPQDMTPDHVAILNQLQLNDPIAVGQLLKLPDPNMPPPPSEATAATATPPATYPPQQPAYPATTPPPAPAPTNPAPTYPPPAAPQPAPQPYPPQTYPPQPYPPQPYPPQAPAPAPQTYPPQSYPPRSAPAQTPYPQQPYPQPAPAPQPGAQPQYPPPVFPR